MDVIFFVSNLNSAKVQKKMIITTLFLKNLFFSKKNRIFATAKKAIN